MKIRPMRTPSGTDTNVVPILDHVTTLISEMDLRYQQRYDAQTKALDAAFLAQQTAMQAALLAAEKAVQTALTAAEKAVTKAEVAAEKRFDAVNEFRAAYQDLIAQQMPRSEAEQRLQQLTERIVEIREHDSQQTGHAAGASAMWGYVAGVVGVIVALMSLYLKTK